MTSHIEAPSLVYTIGSIQAIDAAHAEAIHKFLDCMVANASFPGVDQGFAIEDAIPEFAGITTALSAAGLMHEVQVQAVGNH